MKNKKLNSTFEKIRGAIFTLMRKVIYCDIKDLRFKMSNYIDVVVNDNYSALKRINLPIPKELLMQVWQELQEQYSELSETKEVSVLKDKKSRFTLLVKKREILSACLTVLSVIPDNQQIIDKLKTDFRIFGDNLEKKIVAEIKMIDTRLEEIKATFKDENKDKTKITIEYYVDAFVMLNKNGYEADINMSVLSFIKTMKRFRQEVEENNKQMEKLKNKKK